MNNSFVFAILAMCAFGGLQETNVALQKSNSALLKALRALTAGEETMVAQEWACANKADNWIDCEQEAGSCGESVIQRNCARVCCIETHGPKPEPPKTYHYCVVHGEKSFWGGWKGNGPNVISVKATVDEAKREMNRKGGQRAVFEVDQDGNVNGDPHGVTDSQGRKQGDRGTWDPYWTNWEYINNMAAAARGSHSCTDFDPSKTNCRHNNWRVYQEPNICNDFNDRRTCENYEEVSLMTFKLCVWAGPV